MNVGLLWMSQILEALEDAIEGKRVCWVVGQAQSTLLLCQVVTGLT